MHKILVIDDEPDIIQIVSELIETKFSCGIDTATNGLDGFLMTQKEKYDVILTDHKMPFMTGAAYIIATRTKDTPNKETPMIMLSGFIDDEMRKKLEFQNVQFIGKPFKPTELFDLIRNHLL